MSSRPQESLLQLLNDLGQTALAERVQQHPPTDAQCEALLAQINNLSNFYSGGATAYLDKARKLVDDFKNNRHEIPEVMGLPKNITHIALGNDYEELEEAARSRLGEVGIVLVAGGLGERLGSKQIKVSIECDLITGTSFLELYLAYLKHFGQLSGKKMHLFVMTSDDTHAQTVEFLSKFNYQDYVDVHLEMQDKVPAMADLDANIDVNDEWVMQTKPHGHGDVHFLVKQSGVLDRWSADGVRYIYFIQDTNPFSLASLPVVLGNTIRNGHLLSFVGIKRKSEEPVGALVVNEKGALCNVEYNVFDNYFKANKQPEEKDAQGFGVFPGNINVFLMEMEEYRRILGTIASMKEFINIKFDKTDPKKIAASWRVECLMQDISFSISDPKRINVAFFDRTMAFTTCKNNVVAGKHASAKGLPSETIMQCENDLYYRNLTMLRYCGVQHSSENLSRSLERLEDSERSIENIKLVMTPRIFIDPSFGVLLRDIKKALERVSFDANGDFALILKGKIRLVNCDFNNVSLWVQNNDPTKVLTVENMKLRGKPQDVIQFVPKVSQESALRSYCLDDPTKITKITN
jgi:UDP-sugar pyrophosphorylase